MKRLVKNVSILTLISALLFTGMTVRAESYSSNGSASMLVKTSVASKWEVTIPSSVDFSTIDKQAGYEVSVSGDVADTSQIHVIPDSTVQLSNDSSDVSIDLAVTQTKTSWAGTEISDTPVTTDGLLKADVSAEFGAGKWQGKLNFVVKCTEETDVTQEVYELVKTLEFYGAGDSIMEGYGNNYVGVLDTMNKDYAVNVAKDYSLSGARITNCDNNGTTNVQSQVSLALARLIADGYTDKSVVIFDGGGNDVIAMAKGESNITLNQMDNAETDIAAAFSNIYGSIIAAQNDAGVQAPIVYIIPKLAADGHEDANLGLQSTILSLEQTANDERLIVIDCNEILTSDADLNEDKIHLSQSGYTKLNKAIVSALYNYYSNN